jgi:outer membrane protein assembly factor BamB
MIMLAAVQQTCAQDPTNTFWPSPYAPQGWPAQHHGSHNSDWMPMDLRPLNPGGSMDAVKLMLREPGNPVVCVGGGTIGMIGTNEYFIVTTGKLKYPNLYALDLNDGSVYWHAAPPTNAVDPGPDACALTIAPVIDKYGNIYMADCHYVYSYRIEAMPDINGNQPWQWRVPMPNLKWYNPTNGHWYPTNDPAVADVKGFPFMSFVLSPEVSNRYCVGGFTVQGETFMFDTSNGALVAEAFLETNVVGVITGDAPCVAADFAATNNPMAPPKESMPIFFGIWATGSDTDDPDLDYFMNPCQLKGYMEAGTFGTGAMIANNPCIARDPTNAAKCSLFIAGRQSSYLKAYDLLPGTEDAFVYRVDFDPTLSFSNRLTIMNYVITNDPPMGNPQFAFNGRMPNGENTATAPDMSANEKWVFVGDKQGFTYCFGTERGTLNWVRNTGDALGSPTTFQNTDTNGWFDFLTFGDYEPWFMKIDMETGKIASNEVYGIMTNHIAFESYIVSNHWRTEAPYQETYYTTNSKPFPRRAIGASVIPGTSNIVEMVYTVGWMNPNFTNVTQFFLIPTHQVVLFVDQTRVWGCTNPADVVVAAYMDTNGTSEAGFLPSPSGYRRGLMFYGIQSCCLANYMSTNNWIPAEMKSLYMYPYGGLGLLNMPYMPEVTFAGAQRDGQDLVLSWHSDIPASGFTVMQCTALATQVWTPVEPTNQWPTTATAWTGQYSGASAFYEMRCAP